MPNRNNHTAILQQSHGGMTKLMLGRKHKQQVQAAKKQVRWYTDKNYGTPTAGVDERLRKKL